jgi:hypothetical protein
MSSRRKSSTREVLYSSAGTHPGGQVPAIKAAEEVVETTFTTEVAPETTELTATDELTVTEPAEYTGLFPGNLLMGPFSPISSS